MFLPGGVSYGLRITHNSALYFIPLLFSCFPPSLRDDDILYTPFCVLHCECPPLNVSRLSPQPVVYETNRFGSNFRMNVYSILSGEDHFRRLGNIKQMLEHLNLILLDTLIPRRPEHFKLTLDK